MNTEVQKATYATNQSTTVLLQTMLQGTFIVFQNGSKESTGQFSISYVTPPANCPTTAATAGAPQSIAVWEVDNVTAIYTTPPVCTQSISASASSGAAMIADFSRSLGKTYVVGYCYGDLDYESPNLPIGALLTFAPGENIGVSSSPSLSMPTIIGSASVLSSFSTPSGNNPHQNCNWYGLALGSNITNDGRQEWIETMFCDGSMMNNNATAYLDNVPLTIGQTYSFAFGYGHNNGSMTPSVGMYQVFTVEAQS